MVGPIKKAFFLSLKSYIFVFVDKATEKLEAASDLWKGQDSRRESRSSVRLVRPVEGTGLQEGVQVFSQVSQTCGRDRTPGGSTGLLSG